MFTPSVPTRNGPQCPECNEALDWPARDLPDDHILKCPNGHALCSMGDFRLAAREMALQEEFRLTRDGARSHGQHRVPERPVARMPNTASHGTSHESLAGHQRRVTSVCSRLPLKPRPSCRGFASERSAGQCLGEVSR